MSVEVDAVFGCHLATGRRDKDGYAFCGRTRAHIAAWVAEHGAIAEGLELDHLCRRRHCTALHHLEAITRSENEKRKSWRYRARIKWCPQGHAMELYAVVTPEGGRVCRKCNTLFASGSSDVGQADSAMSHEVGASVRPADSTASARGATATEAGRDANEEQGRVTPFRAGHGAGVRSSSREFLEIRSKKVEDDRR